MNMSHLILLLQKRKIPLTNFFSLHLNCRVMFEEKNVPFTVTNSIVPLFIHRSLLPTYNKTAFNVTTITTTKVIRSEKKKEVCENSSGVHFFYFSFFSPLLVRKKIKEAHNKRKVLKNKPVRFFS